MGERVRETCISGPRYEGGFFDAPAHSNISDPYMQMRQKEERCH